MAWPTITQQHMDSLHPTHCCILQEYRLPKMGTLTCSNRITWCTCHICNHWCQPAAVPLQQSSTPRAADRLPAILKLQTLTAGLHGTHVAAAVNVHDGCSLPPSVSAEECWTQATAGSGSCLPAKGCDPCLNRKHKETVAPSFRTWHNASPG